MALTERFVDPSAPDGGSGTYASPWSSQDTAAALSHVTYPDLLVRLKRGLIYKPQGTTIGGLWVAGKSPAGGWRFASYGDAQMPPTFFSGTNMLPGDSGWVLVGDGLWKKPLDNNAKTDLQESMRLYVGGSRLTGPVSNREGGTGYSYGTARARFALLGDVTDVDVLAEIGSMGSTAPRIWTYAAAAGGASGALYVWTGSNTQDPPTFYDGITLVGTNGKTDANGFGRTYGIGLYGSSNVVVSEADSIFAPAALRAVAQSAAVANSGFEHCGSLAFGGSGLLLEGSATGTATNFFARDCVVDAVATYDEDWDFRDKYSAPFIYWLNARQDAITLGRWTDSATLERVQCIDGYHGNLFVGSQSSSGSQTTVNARVTDCLVAGTGRLYGAGCNVSGLGAGNVATFTRLRCHDVVYFFSRTGSGKAVWDDSLFYNGVKPYAAYDATAGLYVNTVPGMIIYPQSAGYGTMEAGCVTLNRCSVLQPYGFMININRDDSALSTIPAGAFVISDSLLVDTKWINDPAARTFNPGVYDKTGVSVVMGKTQVPAGALVVSNSYFYTGAAGQPRVSYENPNTNNKSFADSAYITGALNEADPKVDPIGRPLIGSPLLDAGTSAATRRRDVEGKQRPNPPSIGAYDRATLRKRLVTDPAL